MNAKLYTKDTCPFCHRAKDLLIDRGINFDEIDVLEHSDERQMLATKYNHPTVPLIFIDDQFIGGCSELETFLSQN